MLLKSLLAHCKHHLDDVHTLFQLLRVYLNRHINSFHFLTTFLENDVAKGYSIEQKRKVFFVFVEMFSSLEHSQELKAKILQYVLIPMFSASFTEGNGDLLLGGPPDPEHDSDENIISVFINKMVNPDKPFGSTVSDDDVAVVDVVDVVDVVAVDVDVVIFVAVDVVFINKMVNYLDRTSE